MTKGGDLMTISDGVRVVAGFFILVSVLLSVYHSQYWLFFTGFVGLNLFQSGFTRICPMFNILGALGFDEGELQDQDKQMRVN